VTVADLIAHLGSKPPSAIVVKSTSDGCLDIEEPEVARMVGVFEVLATGQIGAGDYRPWWEQPDAPTLEVVRL
jgi:hypothetical protein